MSLQALVIKLEAWVQQEAAAQARMAALLGEQERAVDSGAASAVEDGRRRIEAELGTVPARELRRRQLVRGLEGGLGVASGPLTLTRIAEGCEERGIDARRLCALRDELRALTAQTLVRGRRIARRARAHQSVLGELVRILAGATGTGATSSQGGALIDARG
jgi:hypothetical protein